MRSSEEEDRRAYQAYGADLPVPHDEVIALCAYSKDA